MRKEEDGVSDVSIAPQSRSGGSTSVKVKVKRETGRRMVSKLRRWHSTPLCYSFLLEHMVFSVPGLSLDWPMEKVPFGVVLLFIG